MMSCRHAFDLKRQLKNIDKIFARVFPKKVDGGKSKRGKMREISKH
jgi:hypothetical protein